MPGLLHLYSGVHQGGWQQQRCWDFSDASPSWGWWGIITVSVLWSLIINPELHLLRRRAVRLQQSLPSCCQRHRTECLQTWRDHPQEFSDTWTDWWGWGGGHEGWGGQREQKGVFFDKVSQKEHCSWSWMMTPSFHLTIQHKSAATELWGGHLRPQHPDHKGTKQKKLALSEARAGADAVNAKRPWQELIY